MTIPPVKQMTMPRMSLRILKIEIASNYSDEYAIMETEVPHDHEFVLIHELPMFYGKCGTT